jgi:hypothetical protein
MANTTIKDIDPLRRAMADADIISTPDGNILVHTLESETEVLANLSISGLISGRSGLIPTGLISGVDGANDFVDIAVDQPQVTGNAEKTEDFSLTGLLDKAIDNHAVVAVPVAEPPVTGHHIIIIHQPQGNQNDYKFRHESEKHHAMPIKGRLIPNNDVKTDPPYPEIQITNAPPCAAQVWVQCVEYNYDPKVNANPCPNPNGLFIKRAKDQYPPEGVAIIADGEKDGNIFILYLLILSNGKYYCSTTAIYLDFMFIFIYRRCEATY